MQICRGWLIQTSAKCTNQVTLSNRHMNYLTGAYFLLRISCWPKEGRACLINHRQWRLWYEILKNKKFDVKKLTENIGKVYYCNIFDSFRFLVWRVLATRAWHKSGALPSSKYTWKKLINLARVKSVIVSRTFLYPKFGAIDFNTADLKSSVGGDYHRGDLQYLGELQVFVRRYWELQRRVPKTRRVKKTTKVTVFLQRHWISGKLYVCLLLVKNVKDFSDTLF